MRELEFLTYQETQGSGKKRPELKLRFYTLEDILRDEEQIRRLFPEQAKTLAEQGEERAEGLFLANQLYHPKLDAATKRKLYAELIKLLESDDYFSILLYLPFELLPDETEVSKEALRFKTAAREAFLKLTQVVDPFENYNEGDITESERKTGTYERCAKILHLLAFFLERKILKLEEVLEYIETENDPIISYSFLSGVKLAVVLKTIEPKDAFLAQNRVLAKIPATYKINARDRGNEVITPARAKWLKERADFKRPKNFPNGEKFLLGAPFSYRQLEDGEIKRFIEAFESNQDKSFNTVLVGGSCLKGYNSAGSDFDMVILSKDKEALREFLNRKAELAHIVFNYLWVYRSEEEYQLLLNKLALPYFRERYTRARKDALERLEVDSLQYRLLHKGFRRVYPKDPTTRDFSELDVREVASGSTFFETGYRVTATNLYFSNVFIPKL